MVTLLNVADVIALLLLIAYIPRAVLKEQPRSGVSTLVSIIVALALIAFASVSLTVFTGMAADWPGVPQGILLLFLVTVAVLFRTSVTTQTPQTR